MSKATTGAELETILAMRKEGSTFAEIESATGKNKGTIQKIVKRHERAADGGVKTPEAIARKLMDRIDKTAHEMKGRDAVAALRAVSPEHRKRRRGKGDFEFDLKRYVDRVAGRTFTEGCPPISREAAEGFFRSVMAGTWQPPDLSQIRAADPVYPRCQNCGAELDPSYSPRIAGWCMACCHLQGGGGQETPGG